MDRRLELEGWIVRTRRNRRRLAIGVALGTVIAIALATWNLRIGLAGLGLVAAFALCGLWVTASRLADWRNKLERLDKLDRMDQARREAMRSGPHARPPVD